MADMAGTENRKGKQKNTKETPYLTRAREEYRESRRRMSES